MKTVGNFQQISNSFQKEGLRAHKNILEKVRFSLVLYRKYRNYCHKSYVHLVVMRAHNPEVGGSSPSPATIKITPILGWVLFLSFRNERGLKT